MAIPYYFINILIVFNTPLCSYFAWLIFKKGIGLKRKIKIHNEDTKNEMQISIFFWEENEDKTFVQAIIILGLSYFVEKLIVKTII